MIDTTEMAKKLLAGYKRHEFAAVELRETGWNITVSMEASRRGGPVEFKINWPGTGDKTPAQTRDFVKALRLAEDVADKAEVLFGLSL